MADDNLFDRARSRISEALAPTQDGNPSPQARDERPTVVGREEHREEVDAEQVETFVAEYFRNPLIRVPIQNFASDVTEPGYSVLAEPPDDEEVPTVEYEGREMPLDDAINDWLSSCFIDGFSFDGDFATLLRQVVIDRRGRRGTGIVEHAYDNPREREKLMKLKPVKMETVTAYVREGKGIALRPDDEPNEFESVAVNDYGDVRRDAAPTTPAGNTAAVAQFDDVFGAQEREEIPFALDDLTVSSHDADTGALFGRPDSSSIINRAQALRKKLRHVDQSVVNTSFGNVIARVETQSAEVVREVQENLNPNVRERGERGDVDTDPQTVSATNADVDLNELDASVPDVEGIIQQEIEYILSAMPTPLYRIGFASSINRDISSEQSEDYRDSVKRERRRLESDFEPMLEQKARELLFGDAHADEDIGVNLDLRIRPEQAESPLRDEEFDPDEFAQTMSGLKAAAPGGAVEQLVPPHEIREMFLDIAPEKPDPPESDGDDVPQPAAMSLPDETHPKVQETFRDAYLGTRYSEGDVVQSPKGLGIVTGVETEPFDGKDGEIDASEDSPTYVIGLKDARVGVGFYSASELDAEEMPDTGVDDPEEKLSTQLMDTETDADSDSDAELLETTFDIPESWEKSPKPNRLILLDAWSSMGGTFEGARRELGSKELAASMKDRVLQWEGWRG
jgi:hypothetical protein